MEKETMGTVISVTKQWWLKVNRKPVRAHAMDGAAFPHTIKVKYTIDGKDYICRKWIGAGNKVPDKGTTIKVTYCEDKPSKARIPDSDKSLNYLVGMIYTQLIQTLYRQADRVHLQNLHGCLSAEQLLFYKAHGMESDDRYTVYEEDLYLLISGNCESSMPTNG